jgi:hypothetical protein
VQHQQTLLQAVAGLAVFVVETPSKVKAVMVHQVVELAQAQHLQPQHQASQFVQRKAMQVAIVRLILQAVAVADLLRLAAQAQAQRVRQAERVLM